VNDEALIDQIVRQVMEQIHAGEPAARSNGQEAGNSSNGVPTTNASTSVLSEPVITAEILEKHAANIKDLRIGRRSVLTPSAHDFFRKHNIRWSRVSADAEKSSASEARWRAVVVVATNAVEAAFADAKLARWNRQLTGTWREAVDGAVSAVCRAEIDGAVVLCRETAAAACRANRNSRIRAAAVGSVADVRDFRRSLGVNLYCVDPTGKSSFELRNLLRQIESSMPHVPADWKE
jgi:hypothetical protein